MSRSYHVTKSNFRRLSEKELDDMTHDPHSLLHQWGEKKAANSIEKMRRAGKKQDVTLYLTSSKANEHRLDEAIDEMRSGIFSQHDLIETR